MASKQSFVEQVIAALPASSLGARQAAAQQAPWLSSAGHQRIGDTPRSPSAITPSPAKVPRTLQFRHAAPDDAAGCEGEEVAPIQLQSLFGDVGPGWEEQMKADVASAAAAEEPRAEVTIPVTGVSPTVPTKTPAAPTSEAKPANGAPPGARSELAVAHVESGARSWNFSWASAPAAAAAQEAVAQEPAGGEGQKQVPGDQQPARRGREAAPVDAREAPEATVEAEETKEPAGDQRPAKRGRRAAPVEAKEAPEATAEAEEAKVAPVEAEEAEMQKQKAEEVKKAVEAAKQVVLAKMQKQKAEEARKAEEAKMQKQKAQEARKNVEVKNGWTVYTHTTPSGREYPVYQSPGPNGKKYTMRSHGEECRLQAVSAVAGSRHGPLAPRCSSFVPRRGPAGISFRCEPRGRVPRGP
ncbi:unnamed protein product [Prorocentrum cordatum]|uniref:Uncharacterized protein n=1 Tax=Prorocentrum cordatum TaxID=2364126 RepID=A0ABN9R5W8_9DINO|nr:unnamed protein product [Polarella glacialis]